MIYFGRHGNINVYDKLDQVISFCEGLHRDMNVCIWVTEDNYFVKAYAVDPYLYAVSGSVLWYAGKPGGFKTEI